MTMCWKAESLKNKEDGRYWTDHPMSHHGTPPLGKSLYFFLPPKTASDLAEILKPLQTQLTHHSQVFSRPPLMPPFQLISFFSSLKFEKWRVEEESHWDLLFRLLAKVLFSPTTIILKIHHTRHQTPSTHSPGETAFLHTISAKSFSCKSREYTNRFALIFYCIYFLLSSELD